MYILQLISSNGYFGAENVMVQLGAELQRRPNFQMVCGVIENYFNPHLEVADVSRRHGLKCVVFPSRYKIDILTINILRRYIISNKIDVIHSHGYKANLYSRLSTFGIPVMLVATCHNWVGVKLSNTLYKIFDQVVLCFFDHVIVVSQEIRKKILCFNVLRNKIKVIENGVVVGQTINNILKISQKKCLAVENIPIVIGIVGRISEEKGHEYLLKAFSKIARTNSFLSLLIIGDGCLRERLEQQYSGENIFFLGVRYDLPVLYRGMDIFVLPSLEEGMPMVLLEAMAAGLPIVASRVGGVPKVLIDQTIGLLVSSADEEELEIALRFLIENPRERKKMGQRGYWRAHNHYSVVQMADQYSAVYKKATSRELI